MYGSRDWQLIGRSSHPFCDRSNQFLYLNLLSAVMVSAFGHDLSFDSLFLSEGACITLSRKASSSRPMSVFVEVR